MKSSIKHNKLRNTGILFELLVRQITSDVMENKQNGVAVKLLREFFSSKKELGKELMLYRAFFNVQNISEQKAFQLLNLVTEQYKSLNQKELNLQKYLLIKEIKSFPKNIPPTIEKILFLSKYYICQNYIIFHLMDLSKCQ